MIWKDHSELNFSEALVMFREKETLRQKVVLLANFIFVIMNKTWLLARNVNKNKTCKSKSDFNQLSFLTPLFCLISFFGLSEFNSRVTEPRCHIYPRTPRCHIAKCTQLTTYRLPLKSCAFQNKHRFSCL